MAQLKDGSTVGGNPIYHKGNMTEATTVKTGLFSATDKAKLDGIAASANNYTHPSYTSRSIDTSGIEVIDVITSDAAGHVTNVTKRSIQAASTTVQGVVQLNDTISSTSTTLAATANAVKTAYDLANAALPKSGGTVTGATTFNSTLTGTLTGNASTATKLATSRTINGVSFDGSANITVYDSSKLALTGGTLTGNLTIDAGASTTVTIACDDAGEAVLNLCGTSQGTGRIFVGQSTQYGGGIEYNGDNTPVSSGAGSDYITLYRVSANVMSWTARNSQANNDWEFRADVKAATFTTTSYGNSANWKAGYDHSLVAHAPSTAQKNSDITKAEIEAKLTGVITSHTHDSSSGLVTQSYVLKQQTVMSCSLDSNNDEDFLSINGVDASQIDIEASSNEPLTIHFANGISGGLVKEITASTNISNTNNISQYGGGTQMFVYADNDGSGNITYGMTYHKPYYGLKKQLRNVLPELSVDDIGSCCETLSSNTGSYMTVSASSYATDTSPTLDPWKAFDGLTGSWNNKWRTALTVSTGWLKVQFTDRARKIVKFGYKNDDTTSAWPSQVTIYGSNDDTNWTQIADYTDTVSAALASKYWMIENPAYYTYYRFDVVAGGANTVVGFGDVYLIDGEDYVVHATTSEGGSAFEATNSDMSSAGDWSSNTTTYPIVWSVFFPDKLKQNIIEYMITPYLAQGPNTWTVEVYDDVTKTWYQIDSRSSITWSSGVAQTFSCVNSYNASGFRIKITAKNDTYVGMANLKLLSDSHDFFNIKTMKMIDGGSNDEIYRVYLGEGTLDANGDFTDIVSYRINGKYESDWFYVTTSTSYDKSHNLGVNCDIDIKSFFVEDTQVGVPAEYWDNTRCMVLAGASSAASNNGVVMNAMNSTSIEIGTNTTYIYVDTNTGLTNKGSYANGYIKLIMTRNW